MFTEDLYPSVSPCSCHCTQFAGVASSMTENKYSSTQTTDISQQGDESLSLRVSLLADVGRVANPPAVYFRESDLF